MIRKNKNIGQSVSRKEMQQVRGGLGPCPGGVYRRCTYQFNNANACCDWAFAQGADDFSFNTSTCQCCALFYVDGPCGPDIQVP
jgi:hypothetical protein